jgi:low affinity Fe/Cu permease
MPRNEKDSSAINNIKRGFGRFANRAAIASGSPGAFAAAGFVVIVWGATGPMFHFSDTWQLVINTGTTIVTFLMVFVIQNSQNRDSAAIQVKLDEIIRTGKAANTFIGIEHLTEQEIEELRAECEAKVKKRTAQTT